MSYAGTVLADSPVAYYRLGESAGTTAADAASVPHDGTYSGSGYTLGVTGLLTGDSDKAFQPQAAFASGGFVLLNSATWNPGTGAFTIEAWIKTSDSNPQTIAGNLTGTTWIFWIHNGKLGLSAVGGTEYVGTATVNDGATHHVVVTRTGTTLQFYVDGVADGGPQTCSDTVGTTNLEIGALDTGQYPVIGTLDEVAFYNTALSGAQVAAHHTAGTSGTPATPTTATLTGPTSGTVNVASTNFTVTLDEAADQTYTITPASTGTGTFDPASPTITAGNTSVTFTYTPASTTGSPHSISITTSPSLSYSGSPISYTVNAAAVVVLPADSNWFWSPYNWA